MTGSENPGKRGGELGGVKSDLFRLAFLGDVVGRPGRKIVERMLRSIKSSRMLDLVIANGENVAGGLGIDLGTAQQLRSAGVDLITLGDHAFQRKGSTELLQEQGSWCIRPENYPPGVPGRGWCINEFDGLKVGVMNLIGRVFMLGSIDCPYRAADRLLETELASCDLVVCDFHAEATSEKVLMGHYLDGRIAILVGTHTHVQTADERILPKGTAVITDLGMCGSQDGVIGMATHAARRRMVDGLPAPYEVAEGEEQLQGVIVEYDRLKRCVVSIERLRVAAASETASPGSGPL